MGLILLGAVVRPPVYIDLTAVFLGGLSGAIFAVQRKFPITGVVTLAIVTGLGGGMVRDVLLLLPPVALSDPYYLPVVLIAAAIGFFFASAIHRGQLMLDILDPIWMGLFAAIGAQKALNHGATMWAAIIMGCLTAFGGAILRDVLAGETPQLMLPGPINYSAGVIGSCMYVGMVAWTDIDHSVAEGVAVGTVFALRMLAMRFHIRAPEPVDLPKHITAGSRRLRRRRRRGS